MSNCFNSGICKIYVLTQVRPLCLLAGCLLVLSAALAYERRRVQLLLLSPEQGQVFAVLCTLSQSRQWYAKESANNFLRMRSLANLLAAFVQFPLLQLGMNVLRVWSNCCPLYAFMKQTRDCCPRACVSCCVSRTGHAVVTLNTQRLLRTVQHLVHTQSFGE